MYEGQQWIVMIAYQLYNVQPDIMTLAKALGGGVPIGAIVAAGKVADVLQPGTHASTYGGNPLVCAASLAVFSVIEEESGLEKAKIIQNKFRERAESLINQFNFIREYRGAGSMFGIELDIPGQGVVQECIKSKVLINCTHEKVLRILTSIFLNDEEIDIAFSALEKALMKI